MNTKTSCEGIEVIAEVLHKPEESTPMAFYLLGNDNNLYVPKDYGSYVKPFDATLSLNGRITDVSRIEEILSESMIEYEDGTTKYGESFHHGGGFK